MNPAESAPEPLEPEPGRTLSTPSTFFYKFVFPTLWIGALLAVTAWLFMRRAGGSEDGPAAWVFLGLLAFASGVLYWSCMRLKVVTLAGDVLRIDDFRREIEVPLSEVRRVSASFLVRPELVWVHFRKPTPFGRQAIFMPHRRLSGGWSPHPVVEELTVLTSNEKVDESANGGAARGT